MPAQKVFCSNPLKKTALEFQFQVIKDCKDLLFGCSLDVFTHSVKDLSTEYFIACLTCFYIILYFLLLLLYRLLQN